MEMSHEGIDHVLDDMAARSRRAITINDCDFEENGIWYCGVCGQPKQKIKRLAGKDRLVGLLCDCEIKRERMEKQAKERADRMERIRGLRSSGLHEDSLKECTLENDTGINPNMYIAQRYIKKWEKIFSENISMVLTGGVGCGKTYVAACIANALIEREVPVLMTTASRIINDALDSMKNGKSYDFLNEMGYYDLLIIDDYGANRDTPFAMERLFDVIDTRINSGLPLIITTNLSEEEFQRRGNITTERIHSRILGSCAVIKCKGNDIRQTTRNGKVASLRDILVGEE